MSRLRQPLTWAVVLTCIGLASAPAAHYQWEAVVFGVGGIAIVAMEWLRWPTWRSVLVWGWMLEVTLLTLAGLMFRISSPTAPSGPTALLLSTVVGFGAAWAMHDDGESSTPRCA